MKLDCVLSAVNLNPLYSDFIPIFIKFWNKLYPNVDIKIVLIADKIPEKFIIYKTNIILFKPLLNISTAFISQYIRLLYPALLNYNNGVMITDIDNLPMNSKFFSENITQFSNDKWINYRDWINLGDKNQICMMWQIATPNIWKEVFKINRLDDISNRLISIYNSINYDEQKNKFDYNNGWFTDQLDLYKYVFNWNKLTNNYIALKDSNTKYKRLCRSNFRNLDTNIINNIKEGLYSDYHALRPFNQYKNINNEIYMYLNTN